jgi:hypothetical protein
VGFHCLVDEAPVLALEAPEARQSRKRLPLPAMVPSPRVTSLAIAAGPLIFFAVPSALGRSSDSRGRSATASPIAAKFLFFAEK